MNNLLNIYNISLDYPEVSGAEQLELLMIRDQIAELETQLSEEERQILSAADQKLIKNAKIIEQELSQFINLANYRKQEDIPPQKWWWYLDVLSHLPICLRSAAV
jgi:hypothetical protein